MKNLGKVPGDFTASNTCQHQGRLFHFSPDDWKLRVTELILGEKLQHWGLTFCIDCKSNYDFRIGCCSIGQSILVMGGDGGNVFAAIVWVSSDSPGDMNFFVTQITVNGDLRWKNDPLLCGVSDNRALLYFGGEKTMYYCDIEGFIVTMRKLATETPAAEGFATLPIRLPNDKLLVAGACPQTNDIILISCGDEPALEKVGEIPGEAKSMLSTVPLGDRFVVGFGGMGESPSDDLWVFDLQTHKGSFVAKGQEWAPISALIPIVVHDDTLYFICESAYSLSLRALSHRILCGVVRPAFCFWLGVSLPISERLKRRTMFHYIFTSL